MLSFIGRCCIRDAGRMYYVSIHKSRVVVPLCSTTLLQNRTGIHHAGAGAGGAVVAASSSSSSSSSSSKSACFSTSSGATAATNRTAGRKRFYKTVNVNPTVAPWLLGEKEKTTNNTVESPISAGVDDTQSASGVSLSKRTSFETRQLFSKDDDDDTHDTPTWYNVTLDGRVLKTPLGLTLSVPKAALALAIAAEWDAQRDLLSPTQMPLTTLTCTTIDQTNPQNFEQHLLPYLYNDTTCYLADPTEDRVLHRQQHRYYVTLHDYVAKHLRSSYGSNDDDDHDQSYRPALACGAHESILLKALPHPSPLVRAVTNYVRTLNAWELTCLLSLTREAKSLLLGIGVLLSHPSVPRHQLDHDDDSTTMSCFPEGIQDVVMTARIEEEFQIENWGLVEGGHDYDRLNCRVAMASAIFMLESIRST